MTKRKVYKILLSSIQKMLEVIVSKFGGSVLKSADDVVRAENIMNDDPRRRVMVNSAFGVAEPKSRKKITDQLINYATNVGHLSGYGVSGEESHNFVEDTFYKIGNDLGVERVFTEELIKELNQRFNSEYKTKDRKTAAIAAWGEWATAKMIVEHMNKRGIKTIYVDPKDVGLFGEGRFTDARVLPESYTNIETKMLKYLKDCVIVFPGFFLYTKEGEIMVLSRGGSDLTAAIHSKTLGAKVYENFTNTDGVFAADPRIIPNPLRIGELTFREMRDLSYSGFEVLHPAVSGPVETARIPVHIRNALKYPSEGTYVVYDRISDPNKPIVGVAYQNGFCSFDIERFGINEQVGILADILSVFKNEGISIEYALTVIDDISVVLKEDQLESSHKIGEIITSIYSVVGEDASIEFQEHLGSLVVAGKGLKGRRGISAEIQATLANAGINIKFISQGSKERCIIYGFDSRDGLAAVKSIYTKYIEPDRIL